MPAPEPVLVVAAHPDDEVLGCGATMARLAAEGQPVHIAILGEGITSRSSRDNSDAELLRRLHQQAEAAAIKVGAKDVVMLDRKSTRLNSSHVEISYAVFCLKKKTFTHPGPPSSLTATHSAYPPCDVTSCH